MILNCPPVNIWTSHVSRLPKLTKHPSIIQLPQIKHVFHYVPPYSGSIVPKAYRSTFPIVSPHFKENHMPRPVTPTLRQGHVVAKHVTPASCFCLGVSGCSSWSVTGGLHPCNAMFKDQHALLFEKGVQSHLWELVRSCEIQIHVTWVLDIPPTETSNTYFQHIPRKSKDQTLPIGSRESFTWIILKTILCLVLDSQGILWLDPQSGFGFSVSRSERSTRHCTIAGFHCYGRLNNTEQDFFWQQYLSKWMGPTYVQKNVSIVSAPWKIEHHHLLDCLYFSGVQAELASVPAVAEGWKGHFWLDDG